MRDAILASVRSRRITTFQHLTADILGFSGSLGHPAPNISYLHTNDLPPCPICRDMEDFESDTPVIRWFPVVFTEPLVLNV
jgi:hypothetical protein